MTNMKTECVRNTATFILILQEGGIYSKQPGIVDKHIRFKSIWIQPFIWASRQVQVKGTCICY